MYKQEALDSLECFRSNTAHILGDNDEKVKTIETCMMLVQEAEETERWIPVSERLPEKNGFYLTSTIYGLQILEFNLGNPHYREKPSFISEVFGRGNGIVYAWMPLPEPYKERREEHD